MSISKNLEVIKNEIRNIALECGRDDSNVKLLAVSKTKPIEMLLEAYKAGQRLFGENKVQEGEIKVPLMPDDAEFHMIGHLQSNKVGKACKYFDCIQSVDSLKVVRKINNKCFELDKIMDVYLDINISGEDSKTGFPNDSSIIDIVKEIIQLKNVNLKGLMAIGPNTNDKDRIKKSFIDLKVLMDRINSELGINLKELSIGMSSDFKEAIESGSTMVRVGSSIFGLRS